MTFHFTPPSIDSNAFKGAQEYLSRVIAWPEDGASVYANIHWTFSPKNASRNQTQGGGKERLPWSGSAVQSIDEALAALTFASKSADSRDIYVCLATMATAGEMVTLRGNTFQKPVRNQDNVVAIKSLFIDLDAKGADKNSYNNLDEAGAALVSFLRDSGIPRPTMIVGSGGGLHVYWTLSRALSRQEWQPLANALAEAVKRHGLKCDTQCTIDSARVLRVPDTWNYKTDPPHRVRILGTPLKSDYDITALEKTLEPYKVATPEYGRPAFEQPGELADVFAGIPRDTPKELAAGIAKRQYGPIHLDRLAGECAFIHDAIATGGAEYSNPLWNLTTLIATFTDDPRNDAHRMGNRHSGYRKDYTDAFFDRKLRERDEKGLGFPNCATISATGCAACQSCQHFARARSPLAALANVAAPLALPSGITTASIDPLSFHKLPASEAVRRINGEYFVLRNSGKIYRESKDGELSAIPKSDFKTAMGGRLAEYTDSEGKPKARPAADAWHDSPHRREYTGLEYCPNGEGSKAGHKNLFRGWGSAPTPGDCTFVLDHIHEIVAGGDDAKANYLLNWSADILQNPTRKPGVAIVFRGAQGTGKTVVIEILRAVLGRQNVLVTPDKDRILGRFNSAIMNKILLVGEEMLFAGDRWTSDKLKHLVTGQTIPVEFKFGDVVEVQSCHRLILTSNHEQVIQAASEERRFLPFDVSARKRGDNDYFSRLYAVADGRDARSASALMHHLLSRDLSQFRPWAAQTLLSSDKSLQAQKLLSLTPPLMWLREVLDVVVSQGPAGNYDWIDGLPYPNSTQGSAREPKWPPSFSRSSTLDAFRAWAAKAKPYGASEFTGSPERFWREMHKIIPKQQTARQTAGGARQVGIDLADIKKNFEKFLRGEPV
jgi:hypothetical protein